MIFRFLLFFTMQVLSFGKDMAPKTSFSKDAVVCRFKETHATWPKLSYTSSPCHGVTLKVSAVGTFNSLDPFDMMGTSAYGIFYTLDPLMVGDPVLAYVMHPLICERADISQDGRALTIHLNPYARFHNEDPITVKDICFTIDYLKEHGPFPLKECCLNIASMTHHSPHSCTIFFKKLPDGTYDQTRPFTFLSLRPFCHTGHLAKARDISFFVGSGPYKIEDVTSGRFITYKRHSNYWAKNLYINQHQHHFKHIKIFYVPSAMLEHQAFLNKETDVLFETDIMRFKHGYPKNVACILQPKHPVMIKTVCMNLRRDLFKDQRIRKALCLLMDLKTINALFFYNELQPSLSIFSKTPFAHKGPITSREKKWLASIKHHVSKKEKELLKDIERPFSCRFDPQKARELLEQAGCIKKNNTLYTKDEKPFTITVLLKDPKFIKIFAFYKKILEKEGINVIIRTIDAASYEMRVLKHDFDMIVHTFVPKYFIDNDIVSIFTKDSHKIWGASNVMGLQDRVGELLSQQFRHVKTYADFTSLMQLLDRYFMHQCTQIPLFYDPYMRIMHHGETPLCVPDTPPYYPFDIIKMGGCKDNQ